MDTSFRRWEFRLDLFDGGAAGSGTGAGADAGAIPGAGVTGNDAGSQAGVDTGGQAAAVPNPEQDRESQFRAMIKGEYKDLYDKEVQGIIKNRLKNTSAQVDAYNKLTPTLDMLYQKYGVDAGDIEGLNRAITEDETFYEQEALERGLTVQQVKEIKQIERENAELRRQMSEQESRENADRLYAQWMNQAEQIRQVYPGFDINAEMQNEQFIQLLRSNVDMRTAYEVIHKDDIIAGAMQFATQQAEDKVTNRIMAGQSRPVENGMGGRATSVTSVDVAHMTKAQREEIRRRVAMGEKISF